MAAVGYQARSAGDSSAGFSLVEVLIALFLIGIGVLAAAPMFIYAMQGNAVGGDFGTVGAVGVERMEVLRASDYASLVAGGSLTANVTNYFDDTDPEVTVRWSITDNVTPVGTKTITVRVIANRQVVGQRKEITLTTIRGK
jgi:prepilin-type N-terminal cleavage/methylation domain-containing protein